MADSVAAGLLEEKDTETEDKEREKLKGKSKAQAEKNSGPSEVTETLGFYERNAGKRGKRSNLSGASPVGDFGQAAS